MESSDAEVGPAGDGWRNAVRGYLGPAEPEARPGTDAGEHRTPLALQFELRELIPRSPQRWNGPVSQPATVTAGGLRDDHRLGVRPVARTARGWSRTGLSWTNIVHLVNRLHLDRDQHRWFCEFGALHRALGPTAPVRDPDWIFLDEFDNPVLWTLLDQAQTLGVELIGVGRGSAVHRASEARLTLDAVRDKTGLIVTPRLTIDEAVLPVTHARRIADHGIYVSDPDAPRRIVLAPTPERLEAEQITLLASGTSQTLVPASDVDEFVRDFLPGLRERLEIDSSDSSVALPPPAPAVLTASVTYGARHTITLHWRWSGGRRSATPPPLTDVLPTSVAPVAWLSTEDGPRSIPPDATYRGIEAAEFASQVLPRLVRLPGVRIESHGVAPDYRELTGRPSLVVKMIPSEQRDWFDLAVTVTVDGRTIPFLPLFKALAKGRHRLLLVDGTYLSLRNPALQALAELIDESRNLDEWEPVPTISRHQTSLWSDFEDLADEAVPAVQWRALLAEATDDTPQPVDVPRGLRASLRPYQTDGLAWLVFLWRHRLGGILADDMGLGKTLQCLALVQHVVEAARTESAGAESTSTFPRKPVLVVAPTSVVGNWVAEATRFTPDLVVRDVRGTEGAGKVRIADLARGADIVVTSYALLRLDLDAYQSVARSTGWAGLILDEAQFVKNPGSQVHAGALDLEVSFKLAVTGTPLENSLTDLQALFAIVAPGLFASAPRFHNDYVRPIEQPRAGISEGVGAGNAAAVAAAVRSERLARLRRRVRPFLLRRTKEVVAADLPAKHEQTLRIELAPEHRELYDLFLQRERQKLFRLLADDENLSKFIVFRSLTLLRLLALHPSLIGEQYAGLTSSKLDALFEHLDTMVAEGHRGLVFSQFTSYLDVVARRLEAAGVDFAYLDGSTRDRDAVIDGFKTGRAPVFLISLKAGGFGLNLTEADYVFLLDPWWNPASEVQAIDRTHRIGQQHPVMVYRLVASNTIEEKVLALQERKARLFDAVIDDEALFSTTLSAEDIAELLA